MELLVRKQFKKRDLCLRDLGYFDLEELDHLEIQGAYYVSRVKVNTSLFIKNDTPEVFYSTGEIKKHSNFTRVELEPFLTELKPGQTIDLLWTFQALRCASRYPPTKYLQNVFTICTPYTGKSKLCLKPGSQFLK